MSNWQGLEELVAAADTGSFKGAARHLSLSKSHVSRAIAQLEARLEAQLFVRSTRSVALTDTGRILVEHLRRIIQEREEALALVSGCAEPQGEIRITCSTALGERFVAPLVRRYAIEFPRVSISLDLTNRVVDLVAEGYDLGIRTGEIVDQRIAGVKIATRRHYLCASPAYLERSGAPASMEDLRQHDCLLGTSPTWHFDVNGQARVFNPETRWRCNNGAAVLDAALAGMGICQLPDFYVQQAIAEGRLLTLLDDFRPNDEPIWAVCPRRRQLLPKIRNLVTLLEEALPLALNA